MEKKITEYTLSDIADIAIKYGIKIIAAILILVIGFWIAKKISKIILRIMERRNVDVSLRMFVRSLVNILLKVVIVLWAISVLGVATTSIVALLGAIGLGAGMALSGSLQNFAGGIIILLFRPFKVGDFIESQGVMGTVSEIQITSTIIKTIDNKTIYIPNSSLISSNLINYTKEDLRRVDIDFGVGYGTDLKKAKQIIMDIAQSDNRVLSSPEPCMIVSSLADSAVIITARVWTTSAKYWDVRFDLNENVYNAFNVNGVEIPFPQVQVHMSKD